MSAAARFRLLRLNLAVWFTSLLPPRRRDFACTLSAFRLALLASLVLLAAGATAHLGTVTYRLASGGTELWWDTPGLVMAGLVVGLVLYPLVALLLVRRPAREGVRR